MNLSRVLALSAGLSIALGGTAAAQQRTVIAGKVVAAETGNPLADVFVRVDGGRSGVYTDESGRFRLVDVPPGQQVVVAERIGYGIARTSASVEAGKTVDLSITLSEAAALIQPMVVVATREAERNRGSARVDALSGADLRAARATHPSMIMNRIAGVHVSELSGEGHSLAIRQPITTKPMYLYLEDGVPTRPTGFFNHNALYEVNLPQSGGIEVLKGPGTALYGSDAIGGVVNVLTRAAPSAPSAELSLEGGSFGYARALASAGTSTDSHGIRADANLTRSDNWKDAAPFRRYSGTVRHDAFDVAGWQNKTVVTGSYINQFDVPAVGFSVFSSSPDINTAPRIAYRKVRALRLTSAFEKQNGPALWSFTPFARYNSMGLLPSWQLSFDPQTWVTKNASVGLLAKYRRDLGGSARLIVGVDADVSPGSFLAHQAIVTRTGPNNNIYSSYTEGEVHYDYDVTYRQFSPYAQLEATVLPRTRVELGLREDFTGYDYTNNLEALETGTHRRPASTSVSYRHLSPKAGIAVDVLDNLNAFLSYRHGFRAPSQGQLFQQNSAANTINLKPVKVDSYEAGVRGSFGNRLVYLVSAYDMTIRDDIITFVTPLNTREATNAGKTRHKGIEASVGVALLPELRLDASYARSSQRYVEWTPQAERTSSTGTTPALSYNGNLIEQAPRDLASALVTYSPRLLNGGRVAFEWSKTGKYAADPGNTFFYDGYQLFSIQANAFVRRDTELFLRLNNLTDERYAELVQYDAFQKDQYTPGSPRALYAGVRYVVSK